MLLFDVYEPLGAEELAWVGRGVAEALAALHAAGDAHGSVDARHVDIDGDVVTLVPGPAPAADGGRLLYGPTAALASPSPEGDVRALGRLLNDHLALAAAQSRRPFAALCGRRGWAVFPPAWPVPRLGGRRGRPGPGRGWRASLAASALVARLRPTRPGLLDLPPPEQALADVARLAAAEDGARPPTAASVAALIALRLPTARPPGAAPPPPESAPPRRAAAASPDQPSRKRPRRRPVIGVLSAVAAAVVVVASGAWLRMSVVASGRRPTRRTTVAAQPVAANPTPPPSTRPSTPSTSSAPLAASEAGVLTTPDGRYVLGRPGDVIVTGDWFCRGSPLPALLRPASGEVYVFDRWPGAGQQVAGRAVGVVPGATSLRTGGSSPHRCARLVALRTGAPPVPLPVEAEGGAP